MDLIEGTDRDQQMLFPQTLVEYVAQTHPACATDACAEGLDLKALGFSHTSPKVRPTA